MKKKDLLKQFQGAVGFLLSADAVFARSAMFQLQLRR